MIKRDGSVGELSMGDRNRLEGIKDRWSARGKRVILLAQKEVTDEWVNSLASLQDERLVLHAAEQRLTFVGIVGLVDPPVCQARSFYSLPLTKYRETKSRASSILFAKPRSVL